MTRRIAYISGTRADFGLMRRTLVAIDAEPGLSVEIVVTGMHLSSDHGSTVREIEASGLPILARVPVALSPSTGATMGRGVATMIAAFVDVLEQSRPDLVLLLGDRGEMLAGAVAAIHLNIPVAHLHGGERSGTVDEPVRHAISKLSHIHLTATAQARDRLMRMGETPDHVHVVGAPGLDGLTDAVRATREDVAGRYGFAVERPIALVVYHPVLQDALSAGEEAAALLDTVVAAGAQALVLMPNADAGSEAVRCALQARADRADVVLVTHLEREAFLDGMAQADVMVGNSSAGIIEAASFGTPVVNIGTRQNLRERNANVVDTSACPSEMRAAIAGALAHGRFDGHNIYGDGGAADRVVSVLRDTSLDASLMAKSHDW